MNQANPTSLVAASAGCATAPMSINDSGIPSLTKRDRTDSGVSVTTTVSINDDGKKIVTIHTKSASTSTSAAVKSVATSTGPRISAENDEGLRNMPLAMRESKRKGPMVMSNPAVCEQDCCPGCDIQLNGHAVPIHCYKNHRFCGACSRLLVMCPVCEPSSNVGPVDTNSSVGHHLKDHTIGATNPRSMCEVVLGEQHLGDDSNLSKILAKKKYTRFSKRFPKKLGKLFRSDAVLGQSRKVSSFPSGLLDVSSKQQLYVFGGNDGSQDLGSLICSNNVDGSWSMTDTPTIKRSGCGAVTSSGMGMVVGGQSGTLRLSSALRFGGDGWVAVPKMNNKRSNLAIETLGNAVYAIGGENEQGDMSSIEIYAYGAPKWVFGEAMPTSRSGLGVAELEGKLYAIGGSHCGVPVATVEIMSVATGWKLGPSLQTARYKASIVSFRDEICVIGGVDENGNTLASVELFDGRTWKSGPSLNFARSAAAIAVFDGSIYVIGGRSPTTIALRSVEQFDGDRWTQSASLPIGRVDAAAFTVWRS